MFITRASEPGEPLALNQYLVGEGRSKSRDRVGLPLEGRAGAPSWNPEAPGAGPGVSPWQSPDLSSTLKRPQLSTCWGPDFSQDPVCHPRGGCREERKGGKERMSQREAHPGARGRPRWLGSTGNAPSPGGAETGVRSGTPRVAWGLALPW